MINLLLIVLVISTCTKGFAQIDINSVLKKSEEYYKTKRGASIDIFATNKNFLKNDTNYYNQTFLFFDGSKKIGKLSYRDNTGYSIYVNSTTYYIYTYNETYYVGENSSENHLKFLPYWNPSSFFRKYFSAARLKQALITKGDGYYMISFSNNRDWNSVLYIDDKNFSLTRYNETITDKKFGKQFKEYNIKEKEIFVTSDKILDELDETTNSFIRTTDDNIKRGLQEHEKKRKSLIESSINRIELLQSIFDKNPSNYKDQYILLDYFYQTCLPCIKGIPDLNALQNEFDTSLLLVVGVDPIAKDSGHMESFKSRYKVSYPLIDGDVAVKIKKISLPGLAVRYPTLVLIRPDGVIVYIMEEYSKDHFKTLRSHLKKTADEKKSRSIH